MRDLLEGEREYSGDRVLRGLAYTLVLSLALWGAIGIALVSYLRPVGIRDTSVVSVTPPRAMSFCIRYSAECAESAPASLPDSVSDRLADINYAINLSLQSAPPSRTSLHGLNYWQILSDGEAGPCIDYAVTKRHRLIAEGYSPGAFSIAVLHVKGMDPTMFHAVLLARVGGRIYVLDNRSNEIRPLESIGDYEWLSYSEFGAPLKWDAGMPPRAAQL